MTQSVESKILRRINWQMWVFVVAASTLSFTIVKTGYNWQSSIINEIHESQKKNDVALQKINDVDARVGRLEDVVYKK